MSRVIVVALMMLVASWVSAQDQDHSAIVADLLKRVIFDPTTYVPAVVASEATHLDWRSSQIFFKNESREHHPRFTVSRRAGYGAIDYVAGNRQITTDAIANREFSFVNKVTDRVMDRVLLRGYPKHRKLVRAFGWIERSAVTSYLSHRRSAGEFRQMQENRRRMRQFGHS